MTGDTTAGALTAAGVDGAAAYWTAVLNVKMERLFIALSPRRQG
jgi:hypothetical protein